MITVDGSMDDYAIMKQVQQLKVTYPQMKVTTLDNNSDFSALAADELLYLVGHGYDRSGDFRFVVREKVLRLLSDQTRGVPPKFAGIVILSCYSGLAMNEPQPSLAAYLATALTGRVAPGTQVAGVNGYSFGSPEFGKSGLSSVLSLNLAAFYYLADIGQMTKAWLSHKPTHTGGILKDKLSIDVNTGKTIQDHLATVQQTLQKTPEQIAQEHVAAFAKEAKAIEAQLEEIIKKKIPGNSIAERAEYMVKNDKEQAVFAWNSLVDSQYKMFHDFYMWAPPAEAFTIVKVT